MPNDDDILLAYDGQCPVCAYYCGKVDAGDLIGQLVRVDAREHSEAMEEITARGLDIDEGMALKVGNEFFHGADAMHKLALLSSKSTPFNRVTSAIFRRRGRARVLYPVLKAGRNLLLKLLGRSRINNLNLQGKDRF